MNEPGATGTAELTDVGLLARLQLAGAQEREVRAPDALRARLDANYRSAMAGGRTALSPLVPRPGLGMRWAVLVRWPVYAAVGAACVLMVAWFGIGQWPAQPKVALPVAAGTQVDANRGMVSDEQVGARVGTRVGTRAHAAGRPPVRAHRDAATNEIAQARAPAPGAPVVIAPAAVALAQYEQVRDSAHSVATKRSDDQPRAWRVPVVAEGITTSIPAVALQLPVLSTQLSTLAALNLSALPTYAPAPSAAPTGADAPAEPVDVPAGDPTRSLPREPGIEPAEPANHPAAEAWPHHAAQTTAGLLV